MPIGPFTRSPQMCSLTLYSSEFKDASLGYHRVLVGCQERGVFFSLMEASEMKKYYFFQVGIGLSRQVVEKMAKSFRPTMSTCLGSNLFVFKP